MKVLSVVGARPQFIKAAAVSRAMRGPLGQSLGLEEYLVHTGQHYDEDMSGVFFAELRIPRPDVDLEVRSGSHAVMTARMLERLEPVMLEQRPDVVLVYGDTNTTLAGALAAAKLDIPVAHVEAGLRSFNRRMPEEVNRVLADHLSALLFCPTQTAVDNLRREGIDEGVHQVGDVMYDVALYYADLVRAESGILDRLGLVEGAYALATVHRQENTDDRERLGGILAGLGRVAAGGSPLPVVLPLHPRTRKAIEAHGLGAALEPLRAIDPVGYVDMVALEQGAAVILTDSGGVQKEAYFYGVPCVTLRDETEWVETVEAGWNRLAGANAANIAGAVEAALGQGSAAPCRERPPLYGDGRAAERVAEVLTQAFAF